MFRHVYTNHTYMTQGYMMHMTVSAQMFAGLYMVASVRNNTPVLKYAN
jgi:hypothetical protein